MKAWPAKVGLLGRSMLNVIAQGPGTALHPLPLMTVRADQSRSVILPDLKTLLLE